MLLPQVFLPRVDDLDQIHLVAVQAGICRVHAERGQVLVDELGEAAHRLGQVDATVAPRHRTGVRDPLVGQLRRQGAAPVLRRIHRTAGRHSTARPRQRPDPDAVRLPGGQRLGNAAADARLALTAAGHQAALCSAIAAA
ncbi:hypothetical protein ACWY4P_35915 [Streptomyces sp. LZ34]